MLCEGGVGFQEFGVNPMRRGTISDGMERRGREGLSTCNIG